MPICPPRASISQTSCPFAVPPMEGLHARKATASRLKVKSSVLFPILASASPASQPACPAPITIASNSSISILFYLNIDIIKHFDQNSNINYINFKTF